MRLLFFIRFCGLVVSAMLGVPFAHGQNATETLPSGTHEAPQSDETTLARSWQVFQASLKTSPVSPEERVRLVETWMQQNAPAIAQATASRKQAAQVAGQHARQVLPIALPAGGSQVDAAIADGMRAIEAAKLTPEERIRQVDSLLLWHRDALVAQQQVRFQASRQQATVARQGQATTISTPSNVKEARILEIHQEITGWLAQLAPLTPEQRVAAIDAAAEALKQRRRELKVLNNEAAAAVIQPQSTAIPLPSTPVFLPTETLAIHFHMKSTRLSAAIILLLSCLNIHAQSNQTISGLRFDMGWPGTNTLYSGVQGSVIGSSNTIYGNGLTIGSYNVVSGSSMLTVGTGNNLSSAPSSTIIAGNFNATSGGDFAADASIAVGYYNIMGEAAASIIVGQNNVVGTGVCSALFGYGLTNYQMSYGTIVGCYNGYPTYDGIRFAVGSGADANHRSNALEVYGDGRIIIPKRQGDILMGEFGN